MGEGKNLGEIGIKKPVCIYCGAIDIISHGKRINRFSIRRRWFCKSCCKSFTFCEFGKIKTPSPLIKFAIKQSKEYSTREISAQIFKKCGYKISHVTISRWIRLYQGTKNYPSPKYRLQRLQELLANNTNKIIKSKTIRELGGYSKQTNIKDTIAVKTGLIKHIGHGLYKIKRVRKDEKTIYY